MIWCKVFEVGLLGILSLVAASHVERSSGSTSLRSCKAVPGDAAWPSEQEWNFLNRTVGGRLIATKLLGSICHKGTPSSLATGPYNETACDLLKEVYDNLETQ